MPGRSSNPSFFPIPHPFDRYSNQVQPAGQLCVVTLEFGHGVSCASGPVPPPGAGAAAAAPLAPAAGAAEPPWRSPVKARVALAKALIVLGFAAAELALISITLSPETARFMGACAPTDAEAAELRAGAEVLLLAAAAQVLASTVAVLAPARPCALAATALASVTAYRASGVLLMLAACRGHVHGARALHFVLLLATLFVALLVAVVVSVS